MYVKLSFNEQTHTGCMSLSLEYMLDQQPTIIDTLPSGVEANKQVRVPNNPELNEMFGPYNACHYDYYFDCGDTDKETILRVLNLLLAACGGKLPALEADAQYLEDNQNLIVHTLKYTLDKVKSDKSLDDKALQKMIGGELKGQIQAHEKESMKKFMSMMMFGDSNDKSHSEELDKLLSATNEEEADKILAEMKPGK